MGRIQSKVSVISRVLGKLFEYKQRGLIVKGKVAYLSSFFETDSQVLFSWINDRALVLSSSPFHPVHQANHLEWFRAIQHQSDVVIFGIRLIDDDCLVGTCQLHSISQIHRSAELQIRIGRKDARGRGIGKEACSLLLYYAFQDLNLNRVFLHVFETNEPAIRLYISSGFTKEGTLRNSVFIDGCWNNVVIMSILREEYLKL